MQIEDFKIITKKHLKTCKKLVEREGACSGILCFDCPFNINNASNNESCAKNGYASSELDYREKDLATEQSAKAFIKMCEEKKMFDF